MQHFPINGPRQPVYAFMRDLGFSMSHWSDKFWHSPDGIEVSIYGAGSMARIRIAGTESGECALGDLPARLDAMRIPPRDENG